MEESLARVVEAMAKEEEPIFREIRAIAQRPTDVAWEAQVTRERGCCFCSGLVFSDCGLELSPGLALFRDWPLELGLC